MTFPTDSFNAIAQLDSASASLDQIRNVELSKLHGSINAALQLWCNQFEDTPVPMFDGSIGFGFDGRFKHQIFHDELLVSIEAEGSNIVARFQTEGDSSGDFDMTLPLRYLDAHTGTAALLADAAKAKALILSTDSKPSRFSP